MRDDCLFCWYWWYCWSSLFKLSFDNNNFIWLTTYSLCLVYVFCNILSAYLWVQTALLFSPNYSLTCMRGRYKRNGMTKEMISIFPLWTFYLFVAKFKQKLHMKYISLSWYDIPKLVVPIRISLIESMLLTRKLLNQEFLLFK